MTELSPDVTVKAEHRFEASVSVKSGSPLVDLAKENLSVPRIDAAGNLGLPVMELAHANLWRPHIHHLPGGDSVETTPGTTITRSKDGDHVHITAIKDGNPVDGFSADYDVTRNPDRTFSSCTLTEKYPDGHTNRVDISEEDYDAIRNRFGASLVFLGKHEFYMQGRDGK